MPFILDTELSAMPFEYIIPLVYFDPTNASIKVITKRLIRQTFFPPFRFGYMFYVFMHF